MNFSDLLSPVPVERFLADYWARTPLHVPGAPTKFKDLFTVDDFEAVLDQRWPSSLYARAVFDGKGGSGTDPQVQLVSGDAARAAFKGGATVCIDRVESLVPKLDALCRSTALALGYPGDIGVHAYWSPDRAGFRPHFDARIATTLQIQGTKTWRFGRAPLINWPRDNAIVADGEVRYGATTGLRADWELSAPPALLADQDEVTLRPGDFFCVPAGAVHAAEATESSLALNLHFNPVDVGEYLGRVLTQALGDNADWRGLAPLFEGGVSRPEAARALAARMREAVDTLEHWLASPDDMTVVVATELLTKHRYRRPPVARAVAAEAAHLELAPGAFVCSALDAERVIVVVGDARVEASGDTARILRAIIARPRSATKDVAPDARSRQIVDALVDGGVVARVSEVP